MKKFTHALAALALVFAIVLAGCTSSNAPDPSQPATASSEQVVPPVVPPVAGATKIVSLAPSNTDILTALGCGGQIVAIDTYSSWIAGLGDNVLQFDMVQPDAEQIIALAPDVVFTTGMSSATGNDPFKPLRDAGINIVNIDTPSTLAEIADSIKLIGSAVGKAAEADKLVADMQAEIAKIAAVGSAITDRKSVYFEISPAPSPYSFGKGVFLNEMLETIGAVNVLGEQDGWLAVSEETVIAASPDVILTNVNFGDDPTVEIAARNAWSSIEAVKNKAIYTVDNNASSIPSHNVVAAMRQMAKAIYPEQYGDI